jgi:hypothetical protein
VVDQIINNVSRYLSYGWSVVPIAQGTKTPCIQWTEYQTRLPTLGEWNYWVYKFQGCGIALICGKFSGVIGLDCDGKEAIEWLTDELGEFPTAPYVKTMRGYRWLVRSPQTHVKPYTKAFGDGVSFTLLGDNSCFLLPPSLHPTGIKYQWDKEFELKDIPYKYQSIFRQEAYIKNNSPFFKDGAVISVGERNRVLFIEGCKLFKKGYDFNGIMDSLRTLNDRCESPLDEKELVRIVRNSTKYIN